MSTQFIILLIFGGISMLSWAFGKLREQAELKRARDDARKRRDEELRTGRATESAPAQGARQSAAQARAQELAARRQAQLEQLRREQQARAQVTLPGGVVIVRTPPAPPTPPTRVPGTMRRGPVQTGPPGIPVPPRRAPMRPAPPVRSAPVQRQAPTPIPSPRPAPPVPIVRVPEVELEYGRRARRPPSAEPKVRNLLRRPDGSPRRAAELRALFGAMEVLGPPVALRRNDRLI